MKLLQHASSKTYRAAIEHEENEGRLPIARFTWGYIVGRGWGFLHPWAQKALFPTKGTPAAFRNKERVHERFWMLRLLPHLGSYRHPNHDYDIEGRYWSGLVWRASWGKWWQLWRARVVLLDPDIVLDDPGKASDWGERSGEQW